MSLTLYYFMTKIIDQIENGLIKFIVMSTQIFNRPVFASIYRHFFVARLKAYLTDNQTLQCTNYIMT